VARLTWRTAAVASALTLAALSLTACSNSAASSNAHQACQRIEVSLKTYHQATATGITPARAAALDAKAQGQLLAALPFAASATSDDGTYNALMTTIQEGDRVPEGLLTASLSRQCKQIMSKSSYLGL
jgi:hypothetical protein